MTDPALPESAAAQAGKQPLSILLVDDETPVVEMMTAILENFGHKVVAVANNGADAIRLAGENKPDMIILDVGMPGMDGITVAEQILAKQSVPIIIVTGVTKDTVLERAGKLDIQSFLIKPFSKEQLHSAIRLAMVHHHNLVAARNKIEELTRIDRVEAMEKLEAAAQARSCPVADAAKAISATLGR